jgi:predicted MFS family arabinose efflux permease
MTKQPKRFLGWWMVALAFLALNLGTYLPGGVYGAIVHDLQQRFDLNRAAVSMAISAHIFAVNLSAPVIGNVAARFSLRKLMIGGAIMQGAAFLLMGVASSFYQIVALYFFVGMGSCLLGAIPPYTLVSRWFDSDRTKALGFMAIPLFLVLAPPVAAWLSTNYGARGVFLAVGAAFVLLLPVLFFIVDRPEDVGQTAWKRADAAAPPPVAPAVSGGGALLTNRQLLLAWQFWLLTLGYALITGAAYVFVAHGVPYAMQRAGVNVETAAIVMSGFGAAGLFGTVLVGWVGDKIGATWALTLVALLAAGTWAALLMTSTIPLMAVVAAILGMLSTAIAAVHTSAVNDIFGKENVPTVIGLTFFVRLPILISLPGLAGHLFDKTGGYQLPFTLLVVGLGVATAGFAAIARTLRRGPAQAPAAA